MVWKPLKKMGQVAQKAVSVVRTHYRAKNGFHAQETRVDVPVSSFRKKAEKPTTSVKARWAKLKNYFYRKKESYNLGHASSLKELEKQLRVHHQRADYSNPTALQKEQLSAQARAKSMEYLLAEVGRKKIQPEQIRSQAKVVLSNTKSPVVKRVATNLAYLPSEMDQKDMKALTDLLKKAREEVAGLKSEMQAAKTAADKREKREAWADAMERSKEIFTALTEIRQKYA